jgi:hypothetical protein
MFFKNHTVLAVSIVLAGVAGQVHADPMAMAYDHFNASADHASDVRTYSGQGESRVSVGSRGQSPIWFALNHVNADAESSDDIRGEVGVTFVSGSPAYGADIHERIRLEGRGSD